jgi:hypothetical protein
MNMKQVNAQENDEGGLKMNTLTFKNADVMWPADCPDDMLEHAIELAKSYQASCKIAVTPSPDKEGVGKTEAVIETNYAQVRAYH